MNELIPMYRPPVNPFPTDEERLVRKLNTLNVEIYNLRKTVIECLDAIDERTDKMIELVEDHFGEGRVA